MAAPRSASSSSVIRMAQSEYRADSRQGSVARRAAALRMRSMLRASITAPSASAADRSAGDPVAAMWLPTGTQRQGRLRP